MVGRIAVARHGGPEVLVWEEAESVEPGPGQVRLKQTAIGLNFIDVYYRTGLYPVPSLPFVPGSESAGAIDAVGAGVSDFRVGDRVAYAGSLGAYTEARVMNAERVVKVPNDVDDRTAAAMMLKGMTAEYLLHRTTVIARGDTILVHAAAGGVGSILCQWAKALGAMVIGTVGTDSKVALAMENGCDHAIVSSREAVAPRVRELTKGAGVRVVYDSVGKDTFAASLDSLAPRGLFVSYGQSSGKVAPFDPGLLAAKGSLFFTRPTLAAYTATRADLLLSANRVFHALESGAVRVHIGQTYALRDAAQAHADLEGRKTMGSTVLLP